MSQIIKITSLLLPEDIKDTDTFTVSVEPSGSAPIPASISGEQIKNGTAKVRVDNSATKLIISGSSGRCEGTANTIVTWASAVRNCGFVLIIDEQIEAAATPLPASTSTPTPTTTPTVLCEFSLDITE